MRILQLALIYLTYMSEYGVNGRVLKTKNLQNQIFKKLKKIKIF